MAGFDGIILLGIDFILIIAYMLIGLTCELRDGIASFFKVSDSNCFLKSRDKMDFETARNFCEQNIGGHLAFFETETEAALVSLSAFDVWLGIERTGSVWYWKHWASGTKFPAEYTRWKNEDVNKVYGILGTYPYWEMASPFETHKALCELEDETRIPEWHWDNGEEITATGLCPLSSNNNHPDMEHPDFGFKKFQLASVESFRCSHTLPALSKIACVGQCAIRPDCCAVGFSDKLMKCCFLSSIEDTAKGNDSYSLDNSFTCYRYVT